MFKKKKCSNCGKGLESKFSFCPHCGRPLKKKKENYGMLGKKDLSLENQLKNVKLPLGMNTLFNSLMKNLEKQMQEVDKDMLQKNFPIQNNNPKQGGIKISISTSGDNPPKINVQNLVEQPKKEKRIRKKEEQIKQIPPISQEKLNKIKTLPKEEPKTSVRRFSDKVVYEIEVPGVKSLEDISITQLEDSIEIKALATKKAYEKIINLNLPIIEYSLSKGKLILEMVDDE